MIFIAFVGYMFIGTHVLECLCTKLNGGLMQAVAVVIAWPLALILVVYFWLMKRGGKV